MSAQTSISRRMPKRPAVPDRSRAARDRLRRQERHRRCAARSCAKSYHGHSRPRAGGGRACMGRQPDLLGAHVYGALGASQEGGLGAGLRQRLLVQLAASPVADGKALSLHRRLGRLWRRLSAGRRARGGTGASRCRRARGRQHHRRRRIQHGAAYAVDGRASRHSLPDRHPEQSRLSPGGHARPAHGKPAQSRPAQRDRSAPRSTIRTSTTPG